MKKIISIILTSVLLLLICITEITAADTDIVFSKSQNYTVVFVKYGNFTVKSGVNITLVNCGFEIAGSLTVENCASLTGVEQTGDFCFSLKRGCKVSGLDLFYPSKNGSKTEYIKIPLSVFDDWSKIDDEAMSFKWNTEINAWCLTHEVRGNPYGVVFYHTERDMDMAENMAAELYSIGLFKGTGTKKDGSPEFSLNRAPTRVEAIVMLIRLLGKEDEALAGNWNNPFTDIPEWSDKYIGYAYEKGLTKGVSSTSFGTSNATMQQYLTFVLRALGYTDADTTSTLFDEARELGKELRLIRNDTPETDYLICENDFWRADVAVISNYALETNTKNGVTLRESLQTNGNDKTNSISYGSKIAYANWTDSVDIYETCLNSSHLKDINVIHLPIFRISTVNDITAFRDMIEGILSVDNEYNGEQSFDEAVNSYDEGFFIENILFITYVPASSGSFRYEVKDVYIDGCTLTVDLIQVNHPETYTADMSGWYAFTSVGRNEIDSCIEFDSILLH